VVDHLLHHVIGNDDPLLPEDPGRNLLPGGSCARQEGNEGTNLLYSHRTLLPSVGHYTVTVLVVGVALGFLRDWGSQPACGAVEEANQALSLLLHRVDSLAQRAEKLLGLADILRWVDRQLPDRCRGAAAGLGDLVERLTCLRE